MKEGHLFHLVGTHLQADEAGDEITAQAVRVKQMKEMHDWLKGFSIPASEPVIIVGMLGYMQSVLRILKGNAGVLFEKKTGPLVRGIWRAPYFKMNKHHDPLNSFDRKLPSHREATNEHTLLLSITGVVTTLIY